MNRTPTRMARLLATSGLAVFLSAGAAVAADTPAEGGSANAEAPAPVVMVSLPWSISPDFPLIKTDAALRMRNRTTVERYLAFAGEERVDRWRMFTEDARPMVDGFKPLPNTPPFTFLSGTGRDTMRKLDQMNVGVFPDWRFYNNIIFETEDPNTIIVEDDGTGVSKMNSAHPVQHSDHYIQVFRLVDGRIKHYSEVRNETRELRELGAEPKFPRIAWIEALYNASGDQDEPYIPGERDDPALRARNLATLDAYFSCTGAACAERWKLFTADGSWGPAYSGDGRTRRVRGADALKTAATVWAKHLPDWRYGSKIVHQTIDPAYFIVEVDGSGTVVDYGKKPFRYDEHFYYSFRMKDGKILAAREFSDPRTLPVLAGFDLGLPKAPTDVPPAAPAGKQ